MSRRRSFEIDLPGDAVEVDGSVDSVAPGLAAEPPRRGPMAAALRENADSLRERCDVEARIRAENDALAHAHVRARKAGLVLEAIPTHHVDASKLARDRAPGPDPELAELKASILAIGLSNPIRVERTSDGRFELIQGWRRLRAFIELEAEHRDGRFTHIPAAHVAEGDALALSYRRMVDENLVRKDVSFAEMAALARRYAADPATGCDGVDKAVSALFRSAGYQKRSYIRAFAELLDRLDGALAHPQALGRNLGLDLRRRLDDAPETAAALREALAAEPGRSAERELAILRGFAGAQEPALSSDPSPGPPRRARAQSRARTSLRIATPAGDMRCVASRGRLELRGAADFGRLDPTVLEAALTRFLAEIGIEDSARDDENLPRGEGRES